MITEQDIIFDNLYEDIAGQLDTILDDVIADIEEEWGINNDMMMRIVDTWSRGVSDRLPLTVEIDDKARKMLEEYEGSNKILKEYEESK
tara:strand:- start:609 stop:875 length:267 start_codon:yes stop_codon:yes gene_type:complete